MPSWDMAAQHQELAFWCMLVVLAGLVFVCLWRGKCQPGASRDSPEDLLKSRYAKGEIDEETYERMLQNLRK